MDMPKLEKIIMELRTMPGTEDVLINTEMMLDLLLQKLKTERKNFNSNSK